MRIRPAFLLGAVLGLVGCAMSSDVSPHVDTGLGRLPLALTEVDTGSYQLLISKDALVNQREFLLSTSVIETDAGEPSFKGSLSRIVSFKRADGKVQMLESLQGTAIDGTLLAPSVLASFPVVLCELQHDAAAMAAAGVRR